MQKSYFINTYGCQMNVHESEKIAGILSSRGFIEAESISAADIIVYNTCCVRETAEQKVYGHLGVAKKLKEQNRGLKVVLCGCMPQKPSAAADLKKRFPFLDVIIGTHNLFRLGEYLDDAFDDKKVVEIWDKPEANEDAPIRRSDSVNAWINIMYGCNNFCSYCIVPYVRGRERSRSFDKILSEVETLVGEGYKEITLLGQNVNSYGNDLADSTHDFASLLNAVGEIKGKFRIKFMTSHPKDLSERVVQAIASHENLCKYVHLPVQAGNNRILSLMNRKYTAEEYLAKVNMIRSYIPEVGLSSDLMVGFPTETEEEFLDSMSLVEKVRYNNLYTFIYNRRSGTVADKMDGQIPLEVKTDRIKRLIQRQFEIGNEIAAASIGDTYEVLCDKVIDGVGYGKTETDKAVTFAADGDEYGKFVNVKILESKNNKLIGVKLSEK